MICKNNTNLWRSAHGNKQIGYLYSIKRMLCTKVDSLGGSLASLLTCESFSFVRLKLMLLRLKKGKFSALSCWAVWWVDQIILSPFFNPKRKITFSINKWWILEHIKLNNRTWHPVIFYFFFFFYFNFLSVSLSTFPLPSFLF